MKPTVVQGLKFVSDSIHELSLNDIADDIAYTQTKDIFENDFQLIF